MRFVQCFLAGIALSTFAVTADAQVLQTTPAGQESDAAREYAPGRVPFEVVTADGAYSVGVVASHTNGLAWGVNYADYGVTTLSMDTRRTLCQTPCTLWVRPSAPFRLWAGGEGRIEVDELYPVPENGMRVRLRGGTSLGRAIGISLIVGGAIAVGVVPIVLGTSTFTPGSNGPAIAWTTFGLGLAMLGGGITLTVFNRGVARISRPRTHIPQEAPVAAPPVVPTAPMQAEQPVSMTVVPLQGGAMLAAAMQF